jgi:hypothetical protein
MLRPGRQEADSIHPSERKLFWLAHACINVPSTEKWSPSTKAFAAQSRPALQKNDSITSCSSNLSQFLENTKPTNQRNRRL